MKDLTNITGPVGQDQQKSDFTNLTGSLGDAFAAAPPLNAAPGNDDPRAIERAENWIYNDCLAAVAEADRFPAAVAIGIMLRDDFKLSLAAAQYLVECWNQRACKPRLEPSETSQAVEVAYFQPESAARIVGIEPADTGPDGAGATAEVARATEHSQRLEGAVMRARPRGEPATASPLAGTGTDATATRRAMPSRERMAKRRAELKRLGLPAKYKGSLKALVTPSSVTPPIVTPSEVTPSVVTRSAETPLSVTPVTEVRYV